jgi:hypothetical protein
VTRNRTPPRTPQKKKSGRPSTAARQQKGACTKARAKKACSDSDNEDEEEQVFGDWFNYKDGTEGYAEKIIPVLAKRGQGHLNDPVDYIARLEKSVRMVHEGGTKKNIFLFLFNYYIHTHSPIHLIPLQSLRM